MFQPLWLDWTALLDLVALFVSGTHAWVIEVSCHHVMCENSHVMVVVALLMAITYSVLKPYFVMIVFLNNIYGRSIVLINQTSPCSLILLHLFIITCTSGLRSTVRLAHVPRRKRFVQRYKLK